MITVNHTNIYKIADYSKHLKNLTEEDKLSRFGYKVSDYIIDQLILSTEEKNMGVLMSKLKSVFLGRYDGALASRLVKEKLL